MAPVSWLLTIQLWHPMPRWGHPPHHCEQSEAIQEPVTGTGLLRSARNDEVAGVSTRLEFTLEQRGQPVVPPDLVGRGEMRVGAARVRREENPGRPDRLRLQSQRDGIVAATQRDTAKGPEPGDAMEAGNARPMPPQLGEQPGRP